MTPEPTHGRSRNDAKGLRSIALRLSLIFGALAVMAVVVSVLLHQALSSLQNDVDAVADRLLPSFTEMSAMSAAANALAEAAPQISRAGTRLERSAAVSSARSRLQTLRDLAEAAANRGFSLPLESINQVGTHFEQLSAAGQTRAEAARSMRERQRAVYDLLETTSATVVAAERILATCYAAAVQNVPFARGQQCQLLGRQPADGADAAGRLTPFSSSVQSWATGAQQATIALLRTANAETPRDLRAVEQEFAAASSSLSASGHRLQQERFDLRWPEDMRDAFTDVESRIADLGVGGASVAALQRDVVMWDVAENFHLGNILQSSRLVAELSEAEVARLRKANEERLAATRASLDRLTVTAQGFAVALALLSAGAVAYAQIGVRRRLLNLVDGVDAAYAGRQAVIPTEGQDEIGVLGRALSHFVGEANRREDWLRAMLDSSPTAVAVIDRHLTVRFVSRSGRGILTADRASHGTGDGSGDLLAEWVHPLVARTAIEDARAGAENRTAVDGITDELIQVGEADAARWIAATTRGTVFEGEPAALVWAHDLTDRVRAESEVRRTKDMLETALEGVDVGIVLVDADFNIAVANSKAANLFDIPPAMLEPGAPFRDILNYQSARGDALDFRDARSIGHDAWQRDTMFDQTLANGRTIEIRNASFFEVRDVSLVTGQYYVRTYIDVTERRRSERRLMESEALIRSVAENMPGAIFRLQRTPDHAYTLAFASSGLESLFGIPADSLVGRPGQGLDFLPDPHVPRLTGALRTALEEPPHGVDLELAVDREGLEIWVRVLCSAATLPDGTAVWNGLILDATEWKEAEQAKRAFISIVSHELRTPLASIRGSLGLVAGGAVGALPDKVKRLIDIAANNCERLTRLINDILDIEKIESERMVFDVQPHDLGDLLMQAVEANRGYGVARSIRITADFAGPAPVHADEDRIAQVMANLISNAIKFSPDGGEITVAMAAANGTVRVSVIDRGPGIPEAFRARIFQRFTQADNSDTRARGGTGLGLAISKAIVERLGGRIGFVTELGVGTTFFFELPLAGATPAATDVLVVEDDADMAQLLVDLVAQAGGRAAVAPTLEAARRHVDTDRPRLVVLDRWLPDGDGLSLLAHLKESGDSVPTLVISSAPEPEGDPDAPRDRLAGLVGWMQKPFDPSVAFGEIRALLPGVAQSTPRILHVEDDPDTRVLIKNALSDVADIVSVSTLGHARDLVDARPFDLILLDIGLPDGDGAALVDHLGPAAERSIVVYTGGDPPADLAARVSNVLVKSQVSLDDVGRVVRALLARPTPQDDTPPAALAAPAAQDPPEPSAAGAGGLW